jgi:hypothetical protein
MSFLQIASIDIHWKRYFFSLMAVNYKGKVMEDCPVENPSLDGILKIAFGLIRGFNNIRRRGTSINSFLFILCTLLLLNLPWTQHASLDISSI